MGIIGDEDGAGFEGVRRDPNIVEQDNVPQFESLVTEGIGRVGTGCLQGLIANGEGRDAE